MEGVAIQEPKTKKILPQEWIQDYFNPVIGVLSTPEVNASCHKNNLSVVELLELSLTARGADLTVVGEAGALYKALDGDRFDAVLVDLSPLEGALDEACNQARANNPDINIVVISGSVTVQPREDVVWVRKPFEPRELVRAIARSWQND